MRTDSRGNTHEDQDLEAILRDVYNTANWGEARDKFALLFREYGIDLLSTHMINVYPQVRSWKGRKSILYWLGRLSEKNPQIPELALNALKDRSGKVRGEACIVLGRSKNRKFLPVLEQMLDDEASDVRGEAELSLEQLRQEVSK